MHSPRTNQRWAKIRRLGPIGFTLLFGVLLWGVPSALLFSVLGAWAVPLFTAEPSSIAGLLPIALVLFSLGGIGWGAAMWVLSERNFRRSLESDE